MARGGKPKFYVRVQIVEMESQTIVSADHGWFAVAPTVEMLANCLEGEAWKRSLVERMREMMADGASDA